MAETSLSMKSVGCDQFKDYLHILSRFDGQTLDECSRAEIGRALAEVELDAQADLRELVALGFAWLRKGHAIELSATGKLLAGSVERYLADGVVVRDIVRPDNERMAFVQAFARQQCPDGGATLAGLLQAIGKSGRIPVLEYPDEFIRKMRLTGLVSLRGGGRFLDINHNEDAKVEYILRHYSAYRKYTSPRDYFDYMSAIDPELFQCKAKETPKGVAAEKLLAWAAHYGWESIQSELACLAKRKASKDAVMKFIAAPARLEFLVAMAIAKRLPSVSVVPSYPCDDEGIPTSTAGGNTADIECREGRYGVLVEVTMAEGRQQTMMEIWPIDRHLQDYKAKGVCDDAQCLFIAPSIYADSMSQIEFVLYKRGDVIRPYTISAFSEWLQTATALYK